MLEAPPLLSLYMGVLRGGVIMAILTQGRSFFRPFFGFLS